MAEKKSEKPDIIVDPIDDDPEFQEELLKQSRELIKKNNPGLHSVLEKYKNFHREEGDAD